MQYIFIIEPTPIWGNIATTPAMFNVSIYDLLPHFIAGYPTPKAILNFGWVNVPSIGINGIIVDLHYDHLGKLHYKVNGDELVDVPFYPLWEPVKRIEVSSTKWVSVMGFDKSLLLTNDVNTKF